MYTWQRIGTARGKMQRPGHLDLDNCTAVFIKHMKMHNCAAIWQNKEQYA